MTKNIELERGYTKLMDVFEGIRILYGTEGRVSLFKFQGGDTFFGDFYFDNGVQAYPQYAGKIKGHFMFDYQTLYLVLDADKTIDKQAVDIKRVIFSDIERLEVAFEKNSTMYSQWDNIELFDYLHINIFFQEPYTENFRFVIPCHPLMVKGPIS